MTWLLANLVKHTAPPASVRVVGIKTDRAFHRYAYDQIATTWQDSDDTAWCRAFMTATRQSPVERRWYRSKLKETLRKKTP
ncbi:hypothetical protein [Paraburkholderia sp. BCC1876]|uniref:hypothetical protein n=1 Tax=Paraburkholderia sp. BCC1876 TaxID=2676303 RepID=UPI001591309E|nr:hypothetical protein [Paraburkholderia sp. BCC1876]